MSKNIIVSPEELYYLGTVLQANYIDYGYIAAMRDIQKNNEIYRSEVLESLVNKSYISEDFSGNIEVDDSVIRLVNPIFFGELESIVEVKDINRTEENLVKRFHFYEGAIVSTMISNEDIFIEETDDSDIQAWLMSILPQEYVETDKAYTLSEMSDDQMSKIIAVKNTLVGKRASVEIYAEIDDTVFEEVDGVLSALKKADAMLVLYRGVKGE